MKKLIPVKVTVELKKKALIGGIIKKFTKDEIFETEINDKILEVCKSLQTLDTKAHINIKVEGKIRIG